MRQVPCQLIACHGDVLFGMSPYCGIPPDYEDCETDGIIDIFDVLVIIDKALNRMHSCNYCMFGEIY